MLFSLKEQVEIVENLIRVSDMLVFDAKTKDNKKNFNIADIILSHNGYVSGIVVSGKGILAIKHYVPSADIERINREDITIKKYCRFKPKLIKNLKYASKNLLRKKVIAENGTFMGILSDFYIHAEKMQVMAGVVARSLFEDLFRGRILIPGNIIADKADAIKITEIQLENRLHNTKGIINAIDDGLKRN